MKGPGPTPRNLFGGPVHCAVVPESAVYRGLESVFCERRAPWAGGDGAWLCELVRDDDASDVAARISVDEVVPYDPPELVGQGARYAPFVRAIESLRVRRRSEIGGRQWISLRSTTGGRVITCHEFSDTLVCGARWRIGEWERAVLGGGA